MLGWAHFGRLGDKEYELDFIKYLRCALILAVNTNVFNCHLANQLSLPYIALSL